MKHSDFSADFIIIGSGLGGLCAAAYLSRANYRVIVLEKNPEIGGKCTTRTLNGHRYVTGTNGFGNRTDFVLKDLGIELEWISAPFKIWGKRGYLKFPFSFSTIKELETFGMNSSLFLKMLTRYSRYMIYPPRSKSTYREIIDYIVGAPEARELFYLEAWYLGAHPDWLPASSLKFFMGSFYGFNKPIYPMQGSHAVPNALAEYVKTHGGEVLTEQKVTEIGIENSLAQNTKVGRQWFSAKRGIISNAELVQTLGLIKSDSKAETTSLQNINLNSKSAFPFALLLLTLDPSKAPAVITKPTLSLETNAPILLRPISEIIDELDSDKINDFPVCNLVMSDLKAQLMSGADLHHLPVHISILWPKSSSAKPNLKSLTQSILTEVDKRYPGFLQSVLSSKWLTPAEYERQFGFSSSPAPVLETPTYTKHSWKLPIKGLYNVGTTVLPSGSHSGTALESGRSCALDILANI